MRAPRTVRLIAVTLPALLAACGFHLQGVARVPHALAVSYVDAPDRYSYFHRAFTDALADAGVRLAARPEDAGVVIEVKRDDSGQRILSVSARNVPTEYEVYYTVTYRVHDADRELVAPQTLSVTRVYSFDETALLAKDREEQGIRAALARELAALVMRRLAAL
jgi:LPS-assembly lipoprotein